MKTQKILVGTLIAGITMFLLGYLIYGVMLTGFMAENCNPAGMRPMEEMVWWAMIASNLVWGLLITIILDWSNSNTFSAGAKVGAIVGLLSGLGFDLSMYSMSTMFNNLTAVIVDCVSFSVMFALIGGITAMVLGKMGQEKA